MPVKGESLFSEQEITKCLMSVVAWAGGVRAAHRALTAEGVRVPHEGTLRNWVRETYAERYDELREKYAELLEKQLIGEYRENTRLALDLERKALEKAMDRIDSGEDKDPGRTAANAATVADKNTGKMLALSGRPTSIREDRNTNELLRSLVAMGVLKPPDEPEPVATIAEGSMRRDDE